LGITTISLSLQTERLVITLKTISNKPNLIYEFPPPLFFALTCAPTLLSNPLQVRGNLASPSRGDTYGNNVRFWFVTSSKMKDKAVLSTRFIAVRSREGWALFHSLFHIPLILYRCETSHVYI